MRVLQVSSDRELRKIMQDIRVDKYGIDIMSPKAMAYLIKLDNISNITANILKQEMLSLGADCALARNALTGKTKKTNCLLMGNLSQFRRLNDKLKLQPFGLDKLSEELSLTLDNYQRDNFVLDLRGHRLRLGQRKLIMGIVNLTPDSFSGDGLYGKWQMANGKWQSENIITHIEKMVRDGADIIDIGGESSRPGAKAVPLKEELERTIPLLKKIVKRVNVPISIDTYKPQIAKAALNSGASIVNDITGLRNKQMARLIARYKCAVVIMHMRGSPKDMQKNPRYVSLIDEIIEYLDKAIHVALDAGISRERIIIDPGIGFGKTVEHNAAILKSLREFKILGQPILVGVSRKSFIGKILNVAVDKRICGTLSSCVLAALKGADILRVHDVWEVGQALKVLDAIIKAS